MVARALLIASLALLLGPRDALCGLACSEAEVAAPVASAQHHSAQHAPMRDGGGHTPCGERGPERSGSQHGGADECAADVPVLTPSSAASAQAALALLLPLAPAAAPAATRSLASSRPPAPPAVLVPAYLENASLLL